MGFRLWDLRYRVQGLGFRGQDVGFWVFGLRLQCKVFGYGVPSVVFPLKGGSLFQAVLVDLFAVSSSLGESPEDQSFRVSKNLEDDSDDAGFHGDGDDDDREYDDVGGDERRASQN